MMPVGMTSPAQLRIWYDLRQNRNQVWKRNNCSCGLFTSCLTASYENVMLSNEIVINEPSYEYGMITDGIVIQYEWGKKCSWNMFASWLQPSYENIVISDGIVIR